MSPESDQRVVHSYDMSNCFVHTQGLRDDFFDAEFLFGEGAAGTAHAGVFGRVLGEPLDGVGEGDGIAGGDEEAVFSCEEALMIDG